MSTTLIDRSLGTHTPLGVELRGRGDDVVTHGNDFSFSLVTEFECLPNWSLTMHVESELVTMATRSNISYLIYDLITIPLMIKN